MQLLHRLVELPVRRQRQHIQCAADAAKDRILILRRRTAQHPGRDLVAVPGMTDTDAQAMEIAMAEMGEGVAQAVLAAMAPSAAGASSTSAFTVLAVTTAESWEAPRCSAGISTPAGSLICDIWMMSPGFRSAKSSSMNSGRFFGRQEISSSVRLCEITTPEVLPAADASWFRKCSGTLTRSASFSLMRRKSMCIISCLNGCFCQSRTSTFCTLPSTFRSRMDEKNHSCLAASRMVLCSIWMFCGACSAP